MTNEYQEEVIDSQNNDTVEETVEETNVSEENSEEKVEEKVEKPKRTPQEELAYFEGRAKRLRKQLGVETNKGEDTNVETKSDLDYGQKAYLRSFDIKGADEIALVKNWMKRTGDELDTIVEDDIFQAKLNNLREAKKTADAVPKGNKRSVVSPQDESYWLSKIETGQAKLNDIPDISIRRNVLNKQVEQKRSGNKFSDNAVVMGV